MGPKRIIAASIALALLVAALAGALAINQLISVRDSRAWVAHSHEVIEATRDIENLLLNAESGQRGYMLSHSESFLAPYNAAVPQVAGAIARLRVLVRDSPGQGARVQRLAGQANDRLTLLARGVAMGRSGQFAQAQSQIAGGRGFPVMNSIRSTVAEITLEENRLLDLRRDRADRYERITGVLGLSLGAIALVGLIGLVIQLATGNRRLVEAVAASEAARRAQADSDALAQAMFANVPDYLMVLDVTADDRFVVADLNPAFERALRTTIARVRGRAIDELLPGPVGAGLITHYRRVLSSDRPVLTRSQVPSPRGEHPRTWESILAPVRDEAGRGRRIIGSIRDITERVMAEERLRASQRMEAIGQLTGGVAHDFNNLLQVIRGNIELLEPAMRSDERAARRLGNALHGVDRAAQLTRQLLAYARRQSLEPRPINLARLVGDMADMLRRTLGEAIEVETVVAGGLWNTIADPAQVESAVLNLAINARDAMTEGGRLTIELTNAVLDEAYVRQAGDVTPGQYVMLAVTDTGHGMSAETVARVFEPFFTTKSEGQGTGLGLSMVYGFVKQSNGHAQIYSEPGQGTTVKIYLPRTREAPVQEVAPSARVDSAAGQTILVVEDEDAVRAAAVGMLEALGYQCLQAVNAADALAIIEGPAVIDLIFTDVIMPGEMKTRDFANRAQVLRPDTPILFTSGYTQNAIVHQGRLDDGVQLISKPYAQDDLARKVAELLDGRQAAAADAIASPSA